MFTIFQVRQSKDWKEMLSYIETTKPGLLRGMDGFRKVFYMTLSDLFGESGVISDIK